jgi:hypothetical protein
MRLQNSVALAALLTLAPSLFALTKADWDGSTAAWSASAHWSLPAGVYPTADNPAGQTYDARIASGDLTLDVSPTLYALDLGSAAGPQTVTFEPTAATVSIANYLYIYPNTTFRDARPALTLAAGSDSSINTSTVSLGGSASITNNGTLTLNAAAFNALNNAFGGTFTNNGLLLVNTSAGQNTSFGSNLLFNNNATVHVQFGTLTLGGYAFAATPGPVLLDAGSLLSVTGSFSTSSLTGAGGVSVAGSPSASSEFSPGSATILPTGTLRLSTTNHHTMSGPLTVQGTLNASGFYDIAGRVALSGTLNNGWANANNGFDLSGKATISHATFNAGGTTTWASGATLTLTDFTYFSFTGTATLASGVLRAADPRLGASPQVYAFNTGTLTLNTPGATFAITDNTAAKNNFFFANNGTININAGTLAIDAQDNGSYGAFHLAAGATLDLAATYNFASGPTLDGAGLLIIRPGATVTLPMDTAFTGSIEVDGTLVLAPPLDPANAGITPSFTILEPPTPEPASLALLLTLLPRLARRRH